MSETNDDERAKIFVANLETALTEHLLQLSLNAPKSTLDTDENKRDDEDINRLQPIDIADYQIIWLHSDETLKTDNRSWIERRLCIIFPTVMIFEKRDSCLSYLQSLSVESRLFFLGNGDDSEPTREVLKRFPICHILWHRLSTHTMSGFVYLQEQFIEIRDDDDEKEERTEKEKIQQTIDNYAIIFLYCTPIDHSIINRLNTVFDRLIVFHEKQKCFDYINSSIDNNNPIFLILLNNNEPIVSISNKTIKGIYCLHSPIVPFSARCFENMEQLIITLRRDIRVLVNEFPFTMLQKSIRQLDPTRAPYVSLMGLLNVFLSLSRDDDRELSKGDFLSFCRSMYTDNPSQLQVIDRFAGEYHSFDQAIAWYTRDSFVYRLINQALRSQNADLIHHYRFFINDLMHHLDVLYEEQKCQSMSSPWLTIYRGQGMKRRELNKLKRHIGKEFALNSFYSATVDREIGMEFAVISTNGNDILSVLVVLNIDRSLIYIRSYASIEHLSVIPGEREVLITMGSVFRLQSIEFDSSIDVWIINLLLIEHDKDDVKKLKINSQTNDISFVTYQEIDNPIDDENSVHPFFAAAMHDTLLVHQYMNKENLTIEDESNDLQNKMTDIFQIYGKDK